MCVVYVYVCMYVCVGGDDEEVQYYTMCVCVYVCVCARMVCCVCVCVYVCMRRGAIVYLVGWLHQWMQMQVQVQVCVCCVCMCVVYVYVYVCMYVCGGG